MISLFDVFFYFMYMLVCNSLMNDYGKIECIELVFPIFSEMCEGFRYIELVDEYSFSDK